jgi:hypothetical protein
LTDEAKAETLAGQGISLSAHVEKLRMIEDIRKPVRGSSATKFPAESKELFFAASWKL